MGIAFALNFGTIFSVRCTVLFLIFFKIILKRSLILSLENDLSAIIKQKKFDEDMHDFLLAVVAQRSAAA